MLKPVCVPCQRFFRPKHNGESFLEMMPRESGAPSGTKAPELWEPYKLWRGDLWECQGCKAQIVVGVGRAPVAEYYEPGFEFDCQQAKVRIKVNDC